MKITANLPTKFTTLEAFILYAKLMLLILQINMELQIWEKNIDEFCIVALVHVMHDLSLMRPFLTESVL